MHHPDPQLHEVVLALFKYGLASEPQDVALVMGISDDEARRVCDDLVAAGCTLFVIATAITFARLLHGQLSG